MNQIDRLARSPGTQRMSLTYIDMLSASSPLAASGAIPTASLWPTPWLDQKAASARPTMQTAHSGFGN